MAREAYTACTLGLNSTTEEPVDPEAFPRHTNLFESEPAIAYTFMLAVLVLDAITLLGNGLILVAFIHDAKIRVPRNYYILNLAVADIVIAAFSVPFYASTVVLGKWTLGFGFCAVWISVDLVLRLEGIFSILLITYDRYQLVKNPLRYHASPCSKRTVLKRIACSWACAFLLRIPFILTSFTLAKKMEKLNIPRSYTMCSPSSALDPPFRVGVMVYDALYTTFSISFEYFIPLICILYWNTALLLKIRQQTRSISHRMVEEYKLRRINVEPQKIDSHKSSLTDVQVSCFRNEQVYKVDESTTTAPKPPDVVSLFSCTSEGRKLSLETQKEELQQTADVLAQKLPKTIIATNNDVWKQTNNANKKSIHRASLILIFVTMEIIILRTPYVVARVVSLICGVCMSWVAYTSLYWLGWGVSIINPFLYAFISGAFKQYCGRLLRFFKTPFLKVKCCKTASGRVTPNE